MRTTIAGWAAGLALILTFAGCGQIDAVRSSELYRAATPLSGTEWQLELASLAGVPADAPRPANPITMRFDDAQVTGYGGVNRYFASALYSPALYTITFSRPGATRMAGPGSHYENAFFNALVESRNFSCGDGELRLFGQDGRELARFRQIVPSAP